MVKRTSKLPAVVYVWTTVAPALFVDTPSPKVQLRFVIVPDEVSVNVTAIGTMPFVGLAVKVAVVTGAFTVRIALELVTLP
jgi:hypothetical protein